MDTEKRSERADARKERREAIKNLRRWEHQHSRAEKVFGGLIIVIVGAFLLARQMGVALPEWLFTWEMLLIVLGLYVGIKHSFRTPIWIIMMLVGGLFLMDDLYPNITIGPLFWPIFIIAIGLLMIFKPHKSRRCQKEEWNKWNHQWKEKWENKWKEKYEAETKSAQSTQYGYVSDQGDQGTNGDLIETVAVFGGIKKNIISKNFKGGEVVCVFGGAEINLMQADINGTATLELTQVFGGTKLIVPSHWELQHDELIAVLGGIEDKRPVQSDVMNLGNKKLVLRGNCFLGGIEIKTY